MYTFRFWHVLAGSFSEQQIVILDDEKDSHDLLHNDKENRKLVANNVFNLNFTQKIQINWDRTLSSKAQPLTQLKRHIIQGSILILLYLFIISFCVLQLHHPLFYFTSVSFYLFDILISCLYLSALIYLSQLIWFIPLLLLFTHYFYLFIFFFTFETL